MTAPNPLQAAIEALKKARDAFDTIAQDTWDNRHMDHHQLASVCDNVSAHADEMFLKVCAILPTLRTALVDAGWRGIESAPTNGNVFLGYDAYGEFQIARLDEGMFRSFETGKRVDLDAWMPLPRPARRN